MACCRLSEDEKKSREIDDELKQDFKKFSNVIKLLLLGTGESGKTTILKQMKILHINGYTPSERKEKIPDIRKNIHEAIYDIVYHMPLLTPPISFDDNDNETSANYILSIGKEPPEVFDDEYYDYVVALWNDSGVKKCLNRSNEFQLIDCAKYFLGRVTEVRAPDYVPSDQDILHCRIKTTVITKVEFEMKVPSSYGGGKQKFWMFDVGGQRDERKKWIHVICGVDAVLFLIAMNDFDQKLREANDTNRLQESINLFEIVWKNRFLMHTGFIVFLNKEDLLEEKINNGKKIGDYFPDYDEFTLSGKDGSNANEFERTKYFIRHKLISITEKRRLTERIVVAGTQISEQDVNRECYYHFTNATDTNNIKLVFDDIHLFILKQNMDKTNLF